MVIDQGEYEKLADLILDPELTDAERAERIREIQPRATTSLRYRCRYLAAGLGSGATAVRWESPRIACAVRLGPRGRRATACRPRTPQLARR